MEKTISILKKFFALNDIDIKGVKSELLIINENKNDHPSDSIIMGMDNA